MWGHPVNCYYLKIAEPIKCTTVVVLMFCNQLIWTLSLIIQSSDSPDFSPSFSRCKLTFISDFTDRHYWSGDCKLVVGLRVRSRLAYQEIFKRFYFSGLVKTCIIIMIYLLAAWHSWLDVSVLFCWLIDWCCSIVVTVVVLNIHFRTPETHTMTPWIRRVFIHILPRLLSMKRPVYDKDRHRWESIMKISEQPGMTWPSISESF